MGGREAEDDGVVAGCHFPVFAFLDLFGRVIRC
jgi:hypothetical protein